MSYCRHPYYIWKGDNGIEFHKGIVHQGTIDYEGIGQFLVNLLARVQYSNCKELIDFFRMGLKLERENYHNNPAHLDKMMTKKDLVIALRHAADMMEKDIRKK